MKYREERGGSLTTTGACGFSQGRGWRGAREMQLRLWACGLNVRGDVFNRADALGSRKYDDNDDEEEGGRCVAEFSFSSHYLRIALPRCTATRNF